MSDEEEIESQEKKGDSGRLDRDERFRKVVKERNELRQKLAELETAQQELTERLATTDTIAKQLEAAKAELKRERIERGQERALLEAGLTDTEGRDLALYHYGRLPEKDRPELSAWLGTLRSDPAAAPRSMQPFLGEAPKEQASTENTRGIPRTQRSAEPESAGSAHNTPASHKKLRETWQTAQKTGNWDEWKRLTGQQTKQ